MKFNHTTTGFSLQGAHSNAQCVQCHITKRFTGTTTDCFKCHTSDFSKALSPNHQLGKFSHDCLSCHTMTGWKPSVFQHSKTNFQLIGSHLSVDCASCHTNNRFAGLSRDCFSCHQKDFVQSIAPNHVTGKFSHDCLTCHAMTAWQPAIFDHNKTNFKLVNGHAGVECSSCHSGGKFKALATDCYSCHMQDFVTAKTLDHSQLTHDCLSCHTTIAWKPATFNHSKTAFPLVGAHASATCASCHTGGAFKGLTTDCYTCHTQDFVNVKTIDHSKLTHNCLTCHTSLSWKPSTFEHNNTKLQLTGAHAAAECNSCHATTKFTGLPTDCYTCHTQDIVNVKTIDHSKLSHDCLTCHTNISWKPSTFDHNKTKLQLTGAHFTAECNSCHLTTKFTGLPTDCYTCHTQDFVTAKTLNHSQLSHDCLTCHTTFVWRPSTFDHSKTNFQLAGAHKTAECSSCHTNGVFKGIPSDCFSCHQTNFANTTSPNHATAQFSHDCLSCHSTNKWIPSTFNHANTVFPLFGAHAAVLCSDCHKNGQFKGTSTVCYDCHSTEFNGTTTPSHVTSQFSHDCLTCHSNIAWKPATFNHSTTAFPLVGAHAAATVVCIDCHKNGVYKGTTTDCYTCHLTDYNATTDPNHVSGGYTSLTCTTCHNTTKWQPWIFNHTPSFPIGSSDKHSPGKWTLCNDCHNSPGNFKSFACITCHEHNNKASVDNDHKGESGYSYTSAACYQCHPKGRK
ncbi:MAG: hypothetical protein Q8L88_09195 [Bacteroidota bacterium]|nr:hypothetical protein [Bacteroidota bacterium]